MAIFGTSIRCNHPEKRKICYLNLNFEIILILGMVKFHHICLFTHGGVTIPFHFTGFFARLKNSPSNPKKTSPCRLNRETGDSPEICFFNPTVDGSEIRLTSWYGKKSHYLEGFPTCWVVIAGFLNQKSSSLPKIL